MTCHINRALRASLAAAFVAAAATFTGCRTVNDVIVDYRANISAGRYAVAAEEPAGLAAKGGEDKLLWQLMAASAYDLAGETGKALENYDVAEDMMIENDHKSVFAQTANAAYAMMLNDKYFPYDGGGQDRIFTCLYKAVAYGTKGDRDAARTELNRAAQHQENWLWERRKDIAAADARLAKESAAYTQDKGNGASDNGQSDLAVSNAMRDGSFGTAVKNAFGFDIFTSGMLDKLKPADYQNPYVAHVCGIFRWLEGDDDARGYLRDASALRPSNSFAARDLALCEKGAKPAQTVWVYVEDGLCPEREKWRIDLPLVLIPYAGRYVKYAGLSLPRLITHAAAASNWTAGGVRLETIANVDALAKVEYDVYMRGALKREITRTVIDVGIQVALGVTAENVSDWKVKTALIASQYAAAAYSLARRGADTRCWATLPKTVYLARVKRPANGVLEIRADGMPVAQVNVPEGNTMVFVRKPAPGAAASVKVVTFEPQRHQ